MSEQHLRTRRTYPTRSTGPRSLTTTPATTTTTTPFQQGSSRGLRSRPGRGPDPKPTAAALSTRGDKDGDLSMADSTTAAPGAPRFKPYGRPKRQLNRNPKNDGSPPSQQAVQVVITGHKGGSYEDFLDFISQKTITPVVIFENPKHEASKTTIRVKNYEQAEVLVNLGRKGLTFAGNKVIIRHAGSVRPVSISSGSTSTIDAIRTYLLKRYQKERRYLDLEGMATDQELLRAGIRFGNAPPGSQVGAVVIKLASELFPEVETVSVAGNRLRNLLSLASLPSRLPNLKNLSLTGNLISNFRELEPLSGPAGSPKFKNLRELLLAGNPLVENEFKRTGDYINYRSEITRRFPSLQLLDQVPLAPSVQFDIGVDAVTSAPGTLKIPVPIKSGFFDAQVTQEMATNFVKTYLNAYDNDRGRLLDAYDPRAIFSISICTAGGNQQSSNAGDRGTRRYGGRTSLDWSGYTKYDRNLSRVKDLSRRLQTLHVGNTNVLSAITSLPATSHSKVLNEPDRLCIDAWQQHGIAEPTGAPPIQGGHPAMFVNVHGEFVDQPSKSTRSFDRIFTLGPSVAGSPAQLAGWPVVILSDNLTLRPYSGYDAWQPETTTINPLTLVPPVVGVSETATAQPLPVQEEQRPEGVNEAQHRLAIELGRVTGLKYGFSIQCLSENAWNYANALTRFNDLKAQGIIPPGAFAM